MNTVKNSKLQEQSYLGLHCLLFYLLNTLNMALSDMRKIICLRKI